MIVWQHQEGDMRVTVEILSGDPTTIGGILKNFCATRNLHPNRLKAASREAQVVRLRYEVWAACYNAGFRVCDIQKFFNIKHHKTITHGIKAYAKRTTAS